MSEPARDLAFLPEPRSLLTEWRTFGPFGPAYRVDAILRVLDNGDTVFEVCVPRPDGVDEVLERRFSEVLADPVAR